MAFIIRVFLCSLILTLFGVFGGHELPSYLQTHGIPNTVDFNRNTPVKIQNSDLLSSHHIVEYIEVEEEEDDEEESHYDYNRKSIQTLLSLSLVKNEITGVPLFPCNKLIKLYILFHSWKTFPL
ncbi:hypothetical protein [Membranihabitans marinus]|uniref:hypothetical protein n=1 Tax=Membranihabitans marinus TaxID=1227546 RepID=UPI001F2C647D|nr:hypothetical protein [Membranihabitans marinus]